MAGFDPHPSRRRVQRAAIAGIALLVMFRSSPITETGATTLWIDPFTSDEVSILTHHGDGCNQPWVDHVHRRLEVSILTHHGDGCNARSSAPCSARSPKFRSSPITETGATAATPDGPSGRSPGFDPHPSRRRVQHAGTLSGERAGHPVSILTHHGDGCNRKGGVGVAIAEGVSILTHHGDGCNVRRGDARPHRLRVSILTHHGDGCNARATKPRAPSTRCFDPHPSRRRVQLVLRGIALSGQPVVGVSILTHHGDGCNKATLAMQLFGRSGFDPHPSRRRVQRALLMRDAGLASAFRSSPITETGATCAGCRRACADGFDPHPSRRRVQRSRSVASTPPTSFRSSPITETGATDCVAVLRPERAVSILTHHGDGCNECDKRCNGKRPPRFDPHPSRRRVQRPKQQHRR